MRRRSALSVAALFALLAPALLVLAASAANAQAPRDDAPVDLPADLPVEIRGSSDLGQVVDGLGALLEGGSVQAGAQVAGEELVGLFRVEAGECGAGAAIEGSYFRMVQPLGTPANGPYLPNTDSPCGDITVTPLRPGTDGGLSTTGHQPHPEPAFEGLGNGANDRITMPTAFFGTLFSTATNPTDPQTGMQVPVVTITHDGSGGLSGDMRAFAAAWNGQHFNQGAPKPDGTAPNGTFRPEGTFDPQTGEYSMTWGSFIVGGPFNGFAGLWHLEGTFEPAAAPPVADPEAEPQADSTQRETAPTAGSRQPSAQSDETSVGPTLAETGLPVPLTVPVALLGMAGWLGAFLRRRR